jgi:hypothetical protein
LSDVERPKAVGRTGQAPRRSRKLIRPVEPME